MLLVLYQRQLYGETGYYDISRYIGTGIFYLGGHRTSGSDSGNNGSWSVLDASRIVPVAGTLKPRAFGMLVCVCTGVTS